MQLLPSITLLTLLLCACFGPAPRTSSVHEGAEQHVDSVAERQRRVETGLLPREVVKGEHAPTFSIYDRMTHYGVTGVSVAVINDGRVEWAEGYGVLKAGGSDSVTVSTLFQGASTSKPITSMAALRLVEAGRLDLDGNVNNRLRSWHVPRHEYTTERPVTLRGLLSHTAGLTVSGFPGYGASEEVPTAVGVLEGLGNTEPVRVDTIPGTAARYSGGGFTVAQVLIEDVAGEPFARVVDREVFTPLGMNQSTFAQPLPLPLHANAAIAHGEDGVSIRGRWHTYPELAAAGLWTTPTDLARFLIGLRGAWLGVEDAVLNPETAREMLTPPLGPDGPGYGLGIGAFDNGGGLQIDHGGSNRGYRTIMQMYMASGDGVVVMTNADGDGDLRMEIMRAVSHVYGWPDYKPDESNP